MPATPCCLMLSVNRFDAKYTRRHNTTLNTCDHFVTIRYKITPNYFDRFVTNTDPHVEASSKNMRPFLLLIVITLMSMACATKNTATDEPAPTIVASAVQTIIPNPSIHTTQNKDATAKPEVHGTQQESPTQRPIPATVQSPSSKTNTVTLSPTVELIRPSVVPNTNDSGAVAESASCSKQQDHINCVGDGMPIVKGAPDLYGKLISFSPEVFCASDLDTRLCKDVANSLLWAAKEWGNVGPIEYWVMGVEEPAADSLIKVYCNRRWERNGFELDLCIEDAISRDHGMKSYWRHSANWLAEKSASTTMGHNGGRQDNIHNYTSSVPWGFDASYDVGTPLAVQDQKTVFHEYFHAIQHSSLVSKDWDERDAKMELRWFTEGSAEYMASTFAARLTLDGLLEARSSEIARKGPYNFLDEMRNKMNEVKEDYSQCGGSLKDSNYGDKCDSYAGIYSSGEWAHAYLANKYGNDVLLEVFYPNLEEMGFESAFIHAYGQTLEEFYVDFDQFLDLPLSEQLSILP